MDNATPELNARWTNKKIIVHEEDIVAAIPNVPIGRDTLLRENPVCCPVRDLRRGEWETPAITVTVAVFVFTLPHFKIPAGVAKMYIPNTTALMMRIPHTRTACTCP